MTYRISTMFIIFVSSTLWFVGCSDSDNIEAEFIAKLNAHDDKELCFNIDDLLDLELVGQEQGVQYFVNTNGMGFKSTEEGANMLVKLVSAEYVDRVPSKLKYQFSQRDAYKLTEKARKQFVWGKRTCVGEKKATSVVEYTEPSDFMGMTFTKVTFKYDTNLDNVVSELGLNEKLSTKFRLDGEKKANFVKTNKGWRLDGEW